MGVRYSPLGNRNVRHVAVSGRRFDRRLSYARERLQNGVSAGMSSEDIRIDEAVLAVARQRSAYLQGDPPRSGEYVSRIEYNGR